MDEKNEAAHAEHLRHSQDHLKWRAEHMRAFATLKRAEAALDAHEARILAHDAEIARHEEAIAHGAAHAPEPPAGEHAALVKAHEDHAEHHAALTDAIAKIDSILAKGGDA